MYILPILFAGTKKGRDCFNVNNYFLNGKHAIIDLYSSSPSYIHIKSAQSLFLCINRMIVLIVLFSNEKIGQYVLVLKVHKIENFFDSDFGICVISLLVMSKLRFFNNKFLIGPLLGEVRFFRVVLGLRGMKKKFELGPKNFFSSSILDP